MNANKLVLPIIVLAVLIVLMAGLFYQLNTEVKQTQAQVADLTEKVDAMVIITNEPTAEATEVAPEPTLKDLQNGKPFVFVGTNVSHPTVKIMELGFWDACEDLDLHCKFMSVEGNDIAGLVAMMDTITANNTSGISSSNYDPAFYIPAQRAIDAGIPTINWHFIMDKETLPGLKAWVSADVEAYGKAAALAMAD